MLYYIFRWLDQFGISGSHLWGYISFRGLLAMKLALLISPGFEGRLLNNLKGNKIRKPKGNEGMNHLGEKRLGYPQRAVLILIFPC